MRLIMLAIFIVTLISCTRAHVSPSYKPSGQNVAEIITIGKNSKHKIAVKEFTASSDIYNTIMCRGEGPVSAPNNEPFERYIRNALIEELKMAKLLNSTSSKTIEGKLDKIDFFTTDDSYWSIQMTFNYDNGKSTDVNVKYPFRSVFSARTACEMAAKALPRATKEVIEKLINSNEFKLFINE